MKEGLYIKMGFFDFLKPKRPKDILQKKLEIINEYETTLQKLLVQTSSSQEKKSIKIEFLKKVNNELSRNIYFDSSELPNIMQRLASL